MTEVSVATVILSRRNLLTLLSKLDRRAAGERTECTLIKRDVSHPVYPQSHHIMYVVGVEDDVYYQGREAGAVHPKDLK